MLNKLSLIGLSLALLAVVSVPLITPTTAHAQDLDKGLSAYNAGDFRTALKEWRPLAESGNAEAQFYLGRAYENGDGVFPDEETAAEWYYRAAVQDHAQAQFSLGTLYRQGRGVGQSNQYAYAWFTIAGISGNREARQARDELGNSLSPDELANARSLAQNCYENNYKNCLASLRFLSTQAGLAQMRAEFERGWNTSDWANKLKIYRPLAEQGYGPAQYQMGLAYKRGLGGLARNTATAQEWDRKAAQTLPQQAENGDDWAQGALGAMYYQGWGGLAENQATGCSWMRKSAAQGNEWAQSNVDNVC